jgi:hypothetical protein
MLLITGFLLLIMLAGCRSSNNSNGKLPLTKENVQKVFSEQYYVRVDAIDEPTETDKGSVEITFGTKKNVNRKDSPKLIKDIRKELHENFDIGSDNHIELYNYNKKLLGSTQYDNDKIEIGEIPYINIEHLISMELPKYSMSTKFNLFNPIKGATVTATDDEDGDITNKVKLKNSEVLTKLGKQTLIYEVIDSDGNTRTSELDIEITK